MRDGERSRYVAGFARIEAIGGCITKPIQGCLRPSECGAGWLESVIPEGGYLGRWLRLQF
jgi:hypothetical protein